MLLLLVTILETLFANLQEKVFQSDFVISITEEASQPLNIPGSVTLQAEKFALTMFGIEATYDGENLYMYQADANELTISNPSKEELLTANPFAFAEDLTANANLTERDSKDGASTYVTLTPKDQSKGISRFVVKLRKADAMPLTVEMKEGNKTTLLTLKNSRFIDTPPTFTITKEAAFINDLR